MSEILISLSNDHKLIQKAKLLTFDQSQYVRYPGARTLVNTYTSNTENTEIRAII